MTDAEQFSRWLKKYDACPSSYAETTGKSLLEWWAFTARPDWMIWVLLRLPAHKEDETLFTRIAIAAARHVLHLVPAGEDRPRLAIEAAERWVHDPCKLNRAAALAAAGAATLAAARSVGAAWAAAEAAWAAALAAAGDAEASARAALAAAKAALAAAFAVWAAAGAAICAKIREIVTPILEVEK